MAVLARTDEGWLIDHRAAWMEACSNTTSRLSTVTNMGKRETCSTTDRLSTVTNRGKPEACSNTTSRLSTVTNMGKPEACSNTTSRLSTVTNMGKRETCRDHQISCDEVNVLNNGASDVKEAEKLYTPKRDLFSIFHPYRMDSQFEKFEAVVLSSEVSESSQVTVVTDREPEQNVQTVNHGHQSKTEKKRKRKERMKAKVSSLEDEKRKKIADHLSLALSSLLKLGRMSGHLKELSSLPVDNNREARRLAAQDVTGMAVSVEPLEERDHTPPVTGSLTDRRHYHFPELCHTLYRHKRGSPLVISCDSDRYLIPPRAAFYLSQAGDIHAFIKSLDGEKFDLVVLDPPWENKSVKRKKMYYTLANWDLRDVPVPELTREGCLVAVWVTNKHKHQEYVREVLFPHWSLTYLTQWYWLKVTQGGEPVTDLTSEGKKPYESLILGRYHHRSQGDKIPAAQDPPSDRVIISVPCILHSKKPPLEAILKQYCTPGAQCLELFARNLLPGWTSWGNEVLQHQHLKFYEVCSEETFTPG